MTDLPHPAEGNMLERGRRLSREEVASLSNFYILTLDGEGKIQSWESGRENAYQETELQEFAALALETGKTEGRIDSQFFRLDTRGEDALTDNLRREFDCPENRAVLERIRAVRTEIGLSAGSIALAWLTAQPFPTFPLVGASRVEHVLALREAGDAVHTEAQRDMLRTVAEPRS